MSYTLFNISRIKYFNRWLILLNDTFFSLLSSYSVLFLVAIFYSWNYSVRHFLYIGIISVLSSLVSFYICKTYVSVIRHSTFTETGRLMLASTLKTVLFALAYLAFVDQTITKLFFTSLIFDLLITFFFLTIVRMIMIVIYNYLITLTSPSCDNLLIFKDNTPDDPLLNFPISEVLGKYRLIGFLEIGERKTYRLGRYVAFSINNALEFAEVVKKNMIKGVLFMDENCIKTENDRLIRFCERQKVKMLILPEVNEFSKEKGRFRQPEEVRVEDLLSREEININMEEIQSLLNERVVMVTGAAGSIGSEICRQLCTFNLKHLLLYDSAETPLHNLRLELTEAFPGLAFTPILGDVRNKIRVEGIIECFRPEVIFHAAAYKHVPLIEENPCESILTNVNGTRIVADAAVKYNVDKFVMVSTDKAVNPTNVMGASKRLAEIYVQSLNEALKRKRLKGKTRFITTRFGNVLGSNGSVIPLFRQQIAKGGPVTVTHPDIIRYFMTIPEACRLVLEAGALANGGEIYVFDMGEPVKIADLATRMIGLAGLEVGKDIEIKYTGLRPGEKLYEELLGDNESTLPTSHEKIRIARICKHEYRIIEPQISKLTEIANSADIYLTVRMMKLIIPEFISNNSVYEELDKRSQSKIV